MRLIRITTNSLSYLNNFFNKHSDLKSDFYAKQYKELMKDCFGWADFWTNALVKLGYDVWEPVGNAEHMQKAWASENGAKYREDTWLHDIITSQVKEFKPDIVFTNDFRTYNSEFMKYLRKECPTLRLVIGWCASPFEDDKVFEAYNLLLSSIPSYVDYFNSKGHRCEYMCHAFDPRILTKINLELKSKVPISFIGSIVKKENFHCNRELILKKIVQKTEVAIWSDLRKIAIYDILLMLLKKKLYNFVQITKNFPRLDTILKVIPKISAYNELKESPNFENLVDNMITLRAKPALYGLSMFQMLYNSKIVLNIHGDNSARFASNMRLYEATGVGSCILTERQKNLKELFEPEVEVATYGSADEAVEKIEYLISNENECRKIAIAGQKRTLKNHTFDIRALELDHIIRQNI